MVESRRGVPRKQLTGTAEQKPSLTELLENAELNAKQRKAKGILASLDLSDLNLPPDAGALLFLCFLWHDSGSISPVKKITGIKNNVDALSLVNKVGGSDELIKQYEIFYSLYRTEFPIDE